MPSDLSNAAGPMPESCSSCGEFIAPPDDDHFLRRAHLMRRAAASAFGIATPTARLPSSSSRVACAFVRTVRFGRPLAGFEKARAVDMRRPLVHGPLHVVEALLRGAVVVGIARHADLAAHPA